MVKVDEEFISKYQQALQNEIKHGIIMAIKTFNSLNLKRLAEILGKKENVLFYHITEMLKKPKLIEIDPEVTESYRGKYYTLTQELRKKYAEEEFDSEVEVTEILDNLLKMSEEGLYNYVLTSLKNHPEIGTIAKKARKTLNYHQILQNIIINNFEKTEEAIIQNLSPIRKKIPVSAFTDLAIEMSVYTPHQILKITKIISECF